MKNKVTDNESVKGLIIYTKIYVNPEKDVEDWFRNNKERIVERLKKLPSDNLTIYAEPRIRALYGQTYQIFTLGFDNATIVMCGVLLEALLKEIIYFKGGKDFTEIVGMKKADLGHAITFCKKQGYISKDEAEWLKNVKDTIRNPYLHSNIERITKDIGVRGWEITHKDAKELLEKVRLISEGKMKLPPPKILTGKDLRPIGDIIKGVIDERISLSLFLDVDKFVRKMNKQHFEIKMES